MKHNRLSTPKLIAALIINILLIAACNPTPTPQAQVSTVIVKTQPASTIVPPNTATPTEEPPDDTDTPEPSPSPTLAPTVAATFTPSQARDLIISAFNKLNAAYPFRVTEDTTIAGQPLHRVAELNAVDQSHAAFSTGEETIRLGNQFYMKLNGKWSAASQLPPNLQARVDLAAALIAGLKKAAFVGPESINGVNSLVLSYDLQATIGGVSVTGSGQVWVGIADGLPHQVSLTGTAGGFSITSLIVYDEFGTTFNISAPTP